MLDAIIYLRFSISAAGVSPTKEKLKAIRNVAPPSNMAELQFFIGSANFLPKIVPNFARLVFLLKKKPYGDGGRESRMLLKTLCLRCVQILFCGITTPLLN